MKILGYVYRVVSNFAFLALVYYSLNFMEKYNQRAIVAILVLIYASMSAFSALRSTSSRRSSGSSSKRAASPGRRGRSEQPPSAGKSSARCRYCATTAR